MVNSGSESDRESNSLTREGRVPGLSREGEVKESNRGIVVGGGEGGGAPFPQVKVQNQNKGSRNYTLMMGLYTRRFGQKRPWVHFYEVRNVVIYLLAC